MDPLLLVLLVILVAIVLAVVVLNVIGAFATLLSAERAITEATTLDLMDLPEEAF